MLQKLTINLFSIDRRSLSAFRIVLGSILFSDLWVRFSHFTAFYSDQGILPKASLLAQSSRPECFLVSILSVTHVPEVLLFVVAIPASLALVIGYRTQLVKWVCWICIVFIHARNPLVTQGGDILLRILLFWSLFLPLGMHASLDSLRDPEKKHQPTRILSVATAIILLQVGIVYFVTALKKDFPEWNVEGTATYYALKNDRFVLPFGKWLVQFPAFLKILTKQILFFEVIGPFLLFLPIYTKWVRSITALLFMFFHLMLGMSLDLGIFSWIASCQFLLFFPGELWDAVTNKLQGIMKWTQHLQSRVSKILKPKRNSWQLSTQSNVIAGLFFVYILILLIGTFQTKTFLSSQSFRWPAKVIGIYQKWVMFAPPSHVTGWHVVRGILENGEDVNLLNPRAPFSWEKPKHVSQTYENVLWGKYLRLLRKKKYHGRFAHHYSDYLCHSWNSEPWHPSKLEKVEIYFFEVQNLLNHEQKAPHKKVLGQFSCKR